MRLRGEPRGWLKKRAVWKNMSGLIIFPSEDPGGCGSFLQPCDKHRPPWGQNQTDGPDWGQGIEHLVSKVKLICSSSAWTHSFDQGYFLQFYILNLMHISLLFCYFMRLIHFPIQSPASSSLALLLPLGLYLSFKLHTSFPLNLAQLPSSPVLVRYSIRSQLWQALHLFKRCASRKESCETEMSDRCLWTSGGR